MISEGPVIAAIDLGERGRATLEHALEIARFERCAVRVVHVHAISSDRAAAREIAIRLISEVDRGDIPIVLDLVADAEGGFVDAVCAVASDHHARMVIVGPGRGASSSFVTQLLRRSSCPVLVARGFHAKGPVVAATDFSDPDAPVLQAGVAAARWVGAELSAIHVVEPWASTSITTAAAHTPIVADRADQQVVHAAQRLRRVLAELDVSARVATVSGVPAAEIVRHADQIRAPLIVTGTAGGTSAIRLMLGSVAETIARLATCSVLVVRLDRTDRELARGATLGEMIGMRVVAAGGRALGRLVDLRLDTTSWRALEIVASIAASTVGELGLPRPTWTRARLAIPIDHVIDAGPTIVVNTTLADLAVLVGSAIPDPEPATP